MAHSEAMQSMVTATTPTPARRTASLLDEMELGRAREYGLLAVLLGRAPEPALIEALSRLPRGDDPLGLAHAALADAASATRPDRVAREFFDLFVGLGRGEILPYGSYYLTGFLHERPLARLRADLGRLGIERHEAIAEPEDHAAILFDIMSGFADGRFAASLEDQRLFFGRHIEPWAGQMFADLATAPSARFYRAVAELGQVFIAIETEAFSFNG